RRVTSKVNSVRSWLEKPIHILIVCVVLVVESQVVEVSTAVNDHGRDRFNPVQVAANLPEEDLVIPFAAIQRQGGIARGTLHVDRVVTPASIDRHVFDACVQYRTGATDQAHGV